MKHAVEWLRVSAALKRTAYIRDMKRTKIFISLCAILLSVQPALAQDSNAKEAKSFKIMGLSLDMSPAQARQYVREYHGDWQADDRGSSRGSESLIYVLPGDEYLQIDVSGPVQNREITSLRYEFKAVPGRDEQLRGQMRARFGRPVQAYALSEDRQLLIWETESGSDGAELGTYNMIALQTGDEGYLSLSRIETSTAIASDGARKQQQSRSQPSVRSPFEPVDPRTSY